MADLKVNGFTQILDTIYSVAYPVGTIYKTTNPDFNTAAKLMAQFGFGTWEAYGAGRVTVGYSSGETEFNTVGKTGGEKTHIVTEAELPSHGHNRMGWRGISSGDRACCSREKISGDGNSYGVENTGGGQAHNNLQPYIVIYVYRRTA
jgi:hypothetical protein